MNLNTATALELQEVPGIGPSTADKILKMRKSYGAFKRVDDLRAIKGIGLVIATAQATFNPNGVFAAMFLLAVVALAAEVLLTRLEDRLVRWRPNTITDVTI